MLSWGQKWMFWAFWNSHFGFFASVWLTKLKTFFGKARGKSHVDFRTQCVIMTQITWHPTRYYMSHFQILDKTDSFLKNVSNVLDSKKGRLHLWGTAHLFFSSVVAHLAQQSCDSVVTTSLLTLPQRCGTVENESCVNVSFRRCDNVALRCCQDVPTTLLQRRHNIKHWISGAFYYELFWYFSLHRNLRELQKC